MKNKTMQRHTTQYKEYRFDLSKQYIIRRHRLKLILAVLTLLLAGWELLNNGNSLFILLIIAVLLFFYDIRSRNKVIQIDFHGITTEEKLLIEWDKIQQCFYSSSIGKNPTLWLNIKLKNNIIQSIILNGYYYNEKKLAAAIIFYSRKEIFYQTNQDVKNE